MTLETCKGRLKLYEDRGDKEQAAFFRAKVEHKLNLPKYAHLRPKLPEPEPEVKPKDSKPSEVKDGKKPKR